MAVDLFAPGIPTQDMPDGDNGMYDPFTTALRDQLNAVVPYQPTPPPLFPLYVRYPGLGIYEYQYTNVGWHQLPVPSGIISSEEAGRFEAPDIPVTHLPFKEAIYNSTLAQPQSGGRILYAALRSPGINEGF